MRRDHRGHRDADQSRDGRRGHQDHLVADHRDRGGNRDLGVNQDRDVNQDQDGNRDVHRVRPVRHRGRDRRAAAESDDRTATTDDHRQVVHRPHPDADRSAACREESDVTAACPVGSMDAEWLRYRDHRSR